MTDQIKSGAAPGEGAVQGEGDYVAGRRFQDAERSFAETGPVERKAREAERALDGPEAAANTAPSGRISFVATILVMVPPEAK